MITFFRRRAALVLVLTIGYSVLHAIVMFWVVSIMGIDRLDYVLVEAPELTKEGEPYVHRSDYGGHVFRDLNGNPTTIDKESIRDTDDHLFHDQGAGLVPYQGRDLNHKLKSFTDLNRPETYWYLRIKPINGQMRAYLEGYDQVTSRRIGFLHVNGFTEARPAVSQQFELSWVSSPQDTAVVTSQNHNSYWSMFRFSSPLEPWFVSHDIGRQSFELLSQSSILLATTDGVVEVDLKRREVSTRIPVKGLHSLRYESSQRYKSGSDSNPDRLIGRTDNAILLWTDFNEPPLKLTIPSNLDRQRSWRVQREKDSSFILQSLESSDFWTGMSRCIYLWTDQEGKVTRTENFLIKRVHVRSYRALNVSASLMAPCPIAFPVGLAIVPLNDHNDFRPRFPTSFHNLFPHLWPGFLVTAIIGFACARTCYRHERRCQSPSIWFWTIFVGLFGLPGLFGYLCSRDWPDVAVSPWLKGTPPQPAPPLGNEIFGDEETTPSVAVMA